MVLHLTISSDECIKETKVYSVEEAGVYIAQLLETTYADKEHGVGLRIGVYSSID